VPSPRRRRRPLELPRAGPRFPEPAVEGRFSALTGARPRRLALRTHTFAGDRHAVLELVLSGDGASRPASGTTPSLRFVRAAPVPHLR
jgi:hypothetical protein